MTHIVAVSPHLDDAAFSAGGFLASCARAGDRITIVTCFTGNVDRPQGFALACQLDKGLSSDIDYMALRRAEDLAACAVIGAYAVHLPFLEAPHRGYTSVAKLFGSRRAGDRVVTDLSGTLESLFVDLSPDLILGPLAIGDHVDHWIARDALSACGCSYRMWEDWPYADRYEAEYHPPEATRYDLSDADQAAKLAMCSLYRSQVEFQFGGVDALKAKIRLKTSERFFGVLSSNLIIE